jgi:hypothetical protein
MRLKLLTSILISSTLLSACGGSSSDGGTDTPPDGASSFNHQVLGNVIHIGAVAGADVCIDLDQNGQCDESEPSSTTDNDGRYQIDWESEQEQPTYDLIATWIQTSQSVSKPSPLKAAIKPELKQQGIDANSSVVSSEGDAKLMALQDHNGAINSLTNIEFQRVTRMRQAGETPLDIAAERLILTALLHTIYDRGEANTFQLSAAQSIDVDFQDTYKLHQHIDALIDNQLTDYVAVDNVMSMSKEQLKQLVSDSGMETQVYLDSDPMDIRFLVNNTLLAQGYIATPIDQKIMSSGDWQVITTHLLEDEQQPSKFNLAPAKINNHFTLEYGETALSFTGSIQDGKVWGQTIDTNNGTANLEECWNSDIEKWINPDRDDQGYQPPAMKFVNNSLQTVYRGTSIPVTVEFTKYLSDDNDWQAILSTTPAALKLSTLNWPTVIYRYTIEQASDVMCRVQDDFNVWSMPAHQDPLQLTTTDMARLFWPSFYPHNIAIDENAKRVSIDITGEKETYEWSLLTSPSGQPMIQIQQVELAPKFTEFVLPDHYLILGTDIIEITLNEAMRYGAENDYLNITFNGEEDGFNQRFYQHLSSLVTTTQP